MGCSSYKRVVGDICCSLIGGFIFSKRRLSITKDGNYLFYYRLGWFIIFVGSIRVALIESFVFEERSQIQWVCIKRFTPIKLEKYICIICTTSWISLSFSHLICNLLGRRFSSIFWCCSWLFLKSFTSQIVGAIWMCGIQV